MMAKVFGLIVMIGGLIMLCCGTYAYHDIKSKKKANTTENDLVTSWLLVASGCIFTTLGVVLIIIDMG